MRRLYFTIIITVLGALFATGWGLDQLVAQSGVSSEDDMPSVETQLYRKMIDGITLQLERTSDNNLVGDLTRLSAEFNVDLQLEQAGNIALPATLSVQLSQSGGLLLATEQQSYLLKSIDGHPGKLLQLNLPLLDNSNTSFDLMLTVSLYLGVCMIVVLWSLPLTRRLYLLNNAAARFGEGDLVARIPKGKFSYIYQLEHSFNKMADQIENLMADNKILARSLSHDIRTPIACLRFGVEAALDTDDLVKKDQYIQRMDNEISRMEAMTSAFLEYAGLERQADTLRKQPTQLTTWLSTVCRDFKVLAKQQNVEIVLSESTITTSVDIDQQWFYRAVQNLLANAIDYAQNKVMIEIRVSADQVIVAVHDDGPGISDEDSLSVFEPFVRLDAQRGRDMGHFGLGLAIATKVMGWHDGAIGVKNSEVLTGACFYLSLPR